MAVGPCAVLAEEARLDVGRGLAVLSLDLRVAPRSKKSEGCLLDATSAIRAREEGRAAPELIAFRVSVDGEPARAFGPRATVQTHARSYVRIVAALRGDRFALVPIALDEDHRAASSTFSARATSVFGARAIAGAARFVQAGVPAVVAVDPARDHEPMSLVTSVGRDPAAALVIDAGPILGEIGDGTEEARNKALARGGAAALTVLLSDLPLAIATAPSDAASVERLREASFAARAAVLSADPLVAAVGERLTTAILDGFASCKRMPEPSLPPRWPAPRRDLVETGILDDAETGCPHIDDLLTANHPDVRFPREGALALKDAAAAAELPAIGPMVPGGARARRSPPQRRGPWTALLAFAAAVVVFFAWERARA